MGKGLNHNSLVVTGEICRPPKRLDDGAIELPLRVYGWGRENPSYLFRCVTRSKGAREVLAQADFSEGNPWIMVIGEACLDQAVGKDDRMITMPTIHFHTAAFVDADTKISRWTVAGRVVGRNGEVWANDKLCKPRVAVDSWITGETAWVNALFFKGSSEARFNLFKKLMTDKSQVMLTGEIRVGSWTPERGSNAGQTRIDLELMVRDFSAASSGRPAAQSGSYDYDQTNYYGEPDTAGPEPQGSDDTGDSQADTGDSPDPWAV